MGRRSSAFHKKLGILKTEISNAHDVLKSYIERLENICQKVASSKELNKEVCMELGKKCLKSEAKVDEMEEYYNKRIVYYKEVFSSTCKECAIKSIEVVDVYKKYVGSLEEIDRLRCEIEETKLKKRLHPPEFGSGKVKTHK